MTSRTHTTPRIDGVLHELKRKDVRIRAGPRKPRNPSRMTMAAATELDRCRAEDFA